MTDKQIKQSYEKIQLPPGMERRLQEKLDAKLEKPMREKRVILKPKKTNWAALFVGAAAVLALFAAVAGVVRANRSVPSGIHPAASPEQETAEDGLLPSTAPGADLESEQRCRAEYQLVLEHYLTALSEEMDDSVRQALGVSGIVQDFYGQDPLGRVGYAFADLNGDGQEELLIGCVEDEEYYGRILFDVYYLRDGRPIKLAESMDRVRWYDCGLGELICEGDESDSAKRWLLFRLDPEKQDLYEGMELQGGIYYDGNGDREEGERLGVDKIYYWRWDPTDAKQGQKGDPVRNDTAGDWLMRHSVRYVHHDFRSFRELYPELYGFAPSTPTPEDTSSD